MMAVVAMLWAMVALGQQAGLTINEELRHHTITLTAVSDDIVRVSCNLAALPRLLKNNNPCCCHLP